MDKIDELMNALYYHRDASRAALRAEFDAQAKRIEELDLLYKLALGRIELGDNRISALQSELAALKEAQRWIAVEDELPEKSQNYLVCAIFPTGVKPFIDVCYYVRSFGFADFGAHITHWMPLPQPPEEE